MLFLRYLMSGFTCFGNKQEFYCFWRFRSRFAVICCDFPFIVIWKNSERGSANIFNQMHHQFAIADSCKYSATHTNITTAKTVTKMTSFEYLSTVISVKHILIYKLKNSLKIFILRD